MFSLTYGRLPWRTLLKYLCSDILHKSTNTKCCCCSLYANFEWHNTVI